MDVHDFVKKLTRDIAWTLSGVKQVPSGIEGDDIRRLQSAYNALMALEPRELREQRAIPVERGEA
jgi:hypothetical protein